MLQDPEMLRQSMEMARNPALRDEMVRNQDQALRNVESMPGGFNALRQMHHQVRSPHLLFHRVGVMHHHARSLWLPPQRIVLVTPAVCCPNRLIQTTSALGCFLDLPLQA
jgi:hypothetical protein